jgi:hypothetical protein
MAPESEKPLPLLDRCRDVRDEPLIMREIRSRQAEPCRRFAVVPDVIASYLPIEERELEAGGVN